MYDENGREPGDGWKETTVRIVGATGAKEVPGLAHPAARGVAVTYMAPWGLFTVTHIASGMRLGGPFERAGSAAFEAAQWATLFDLEAAHTDKDLLAQINDEPVPFDGFTITDASGTRRQTRREWFRAHMPTWERDEFPAEEESPWEKADRILEPQPAS